MSTSWDPYGSVGGVAHAATGNPSGPLISHNHHLPPHHHLMTSSTPAAVISSAPPSSIYSHAGNSTSILVNPIMSPGTTAHPGHIMAPRGHPVTAPQQSYQLPPYPPTSSYPAHLGSHGQPLPHGSPHALPPYSGTPVIHPYPPPTTTNVSSSPYHHPLAPVPPLPGTAPLPPPLGVPPYTPQHPYTQPPLHVPMSTPPMTTQHHVVPMPPHNQHAQPYNLKVSSGNSPQPMTAPLTPGPVPQTPIGGPPPTPFSNGPPGGPEHDLPPELLSAGWRKFWSKRENRWYWWNCNSGESLWDPPPLPGRYPPQPGAVSW